MARLFSYALFLMIVAPINIWLDIYSGFRLEGRGDLIIRPFAQAAFYFYAGTIAAEVMFRISNLGNHFDVGPALKLTSCAALFCVAILCIEFLAYTYPDLLNGNTVEDRVGFQLGIAFATVAVSVLAYYFEGAKVREQDSYAI